MKCSGPPIDVHTAMRRLCAPVVEQSGCQQVADIVDLAAVAGPNGSIHIAGLTHNDDPQQLHGHKPLRVDANHQALALAIPLRAGEYCTPPVTLSDGATVFASWVPKVKFDFDGMIGWTRYCNISSPRLVHNQWERQLDPIDLHTRMTPVPWAPVPGINGAVLALLNKNRELECITADGSTAWIFRKPWADFDHAPAVGPDGSVFLQINPHGELYAINADGTPRWEKELGGAVRCSPLAAADGGVIALSARKEGGTLLQHFPNRDQSDWSVTLPCANYSGLAETSDGLILLNAEDKPRLQVMEAGGRILNELSLPGTPLGPPLPTEDGQHRVVTRNGWVVTVKVRPPGAELPPAATPPPGSVSMEDQWVVLGDVRVRRRFS